MAQRTWPRNTRKERFWREVIGGHAKSGLSVKAYCSGRGVSEASFFAWRRELARRDAEPPQPKKVRERLASQPPRHISRLKATPVRQAPPQWAQLQVTPGESSLHGSMIEIVFPAGVRVRVAEGASRQTLTDVLAVLEIPRC
jgi:Transposase